ncbi:hypothetical protein [Streptomyces bambusae]|uniref:Uncharacterized protein n=1 Tax=Streptomyces bambusae TaxID=1550616 RepID=A0ABS6Z0B4_9ACTN|nr:hypothetical protein [Streptomyces bambusae]MBW5481182.1 hypothetical protein [Streptomyces bambusae]
MTAPTAPAASPTLPLSPTVTSQPGYRDRVRTRYAAAAEERIEKAQAAAVELGCTGPVPWGDIRAVYTRPPRSPWKSYTTVVGGIVTNAFGVAMVLGFGVVMLLGAGLAIDKENRAEAATKTAPPAQRAAAVAAAHSGLTHQEKKDLAFFGIAVVGGAFLTSSWRGINDRRNKMGKGYAKEGEEVVTEALEVLPALAAVVGAPVGRPRAEALALVHEKASALMTAVTDSSKWAAGIPRYAGDRGRLKEHGQKVRTAFADKLGGLVEDREATARALGAMALSVATRQAQSAYGALLNADALPAEPGPEVPDLRGVRKVFVGAGIAALGVFMAGTMGGADLMAAIPLALAVFGLGSFLGALFTGKLHAIGQAYAAFKQNGSGAP